MIFDDNSKIFFVKSSYKPMLWMLIRIGEAILMSTHNIGFNEEISKIITLLSLNVIEYAPYFFCCCQV